MGNTFQKLRSTAQDTPNNILNCGIENTTKEITHQK